LKKISILLLDDHLIILDGLRNMLKKEEHLTICGSHLSAIEALKNTLINHPDIIITDLMMPEMSGIDFIKTVKSYNIKSKILVLSMCRLPNVIKEVRAAGAKGFIMKQNASHNEIMKAIETLIEGNNYYPVEILEILNSKDRQEINKNELRRIMPEINILSKNELKVLKLFADGLPYEEMSKNLDMSVKLIEKHKSNIMIKLNFKSNVDLIKFAVKNSICYV
jgi:DNA-binding NarL/FixJ family response regulator